MKKVRKGFISTIALVFAFLFSGCALVSSGIDAYEAYEKEKATYFVAFSNEKEEGDPFDYLEIEDYESEFSAFNSRVMYETLSEEEKRIYRFYEYALDHGYTSVFIDSRLLEGVEVSLVEILNFLSMDSPFVQQNYEYSKGDTGYTFSYLYDQLQFEVSGVKITTSLFDGTNLEKKKEAKMAAESLIQAMPQGLSDLEKARYFYRYLTGEVTYRLYEEGEEPHYLYDALCKKETQCDGFANAFSLLCAMENIPCVEKIYNAQSEEELGHTWNCFYADGLWYNADCAVSEEFAKDQKELGIDFYFGFSDERQGDTPVFLSRLPVCTTDLIPVSLVLSSPDDPAMCSQISRAFSSVGTNGILIRIESGPLGDDDLQKIANYLQSDLYSIPTQWNGVHHCYLFQKG